MTVTELPGSSAPAAGPIVDRPGIYEMTNEQYHADPVPGGSLSSTGARRLLAPSCPARYKYERDHGRAPKRHFDIGHAAHKLVLGTGPELALIDADEWRTAKVKAAVVEARERGAVPLKPAEWEQVHAMAEAIRQHPVASVLFAPGRGRPEQALFWWDQQSRVIRRAMFDWLPDRGADRLVVPDYKTTTAADLESIAKAVEKYGYHQQGAWYLDGAKALGLHGGVEPAFVFVVQEKAAPYLVTVVELDVVALRIGQARNRRALEIYRECTDSGRWPGYSDDVELIALPAWAEARDTEEYL
ncbi:PD-(D/E)XK nuclease-like domain-containing protein [Kitasatospora purpeofusca]|uniref:PD-(D/E)XK nuclease-like domain-containing protein n=1 Tax=Kitasatospora purpeofusca TaxID=67352 RepID=UPI003668558E